MRPHRCRCEVDVQTLRNASLFALLTLIVDFVPLAMALVYVVRPTERHLALMRPLSLAGLFAALAGGTLGFLNVLLALGVAQDFSVDTYRRTAIGASESVVPMFLGFACLTVAWLLVAAGMGRRHSEV
ncbi:MAG: hypothetical protein C5B57_01555 [Blastocatellia bacterium]|nr:MAG: hypothetical protein C5B57_01555 [Blastocatellia bacterium]